MNKQKLVWRVDPKPVGRYRSFEKRGWPTCYYGHADGPIAAKLYCADAYEPRDVRTGNHANIVIYVAHWGVVPFKWFVLKRRAPTLDEAKSIASDFLARHPDWAPPQVVWKQYE